MGTTQGCTRPNGPGAVRRPSDAIALVRAVLGDGTVCSGELVLGLDHARCLTGAGVRPSPEEHDAIDVEQLVDLASALDAEALVLVSLLADERELVHEADVDGFLGLARACLGRGVLLLDHVLVAGPTWCSLWDAVLTA